MKIKRTLEPEVMDSPEEANDYDAMDHTAVNAQFVTDLLESAPSPGDVLDLGTGTAQIPIELARRQEDCRIMAVDLAVHMLDRARLNLEVAGLIMRVQLEQIDAKDLPFPDDYFDTVISNSIVHHIPDPRHVLAEAVRVTRPEGLLFFRDLMRPETADQVERLVAIHAGDDNDHQQKMFRESLHAALDLNEIGDLVESLGFDRSGVRATSDRHWTWIGRKPADTVN